MSIKILSNIDNFSHSVTQLAQKQPTSFLGKIWHKIFNWSEDPIHNSFKNLMLDAEKIINTLSEKKLESFKFKEALNKVFKEIFPHLEKNPFSKTNKMSKVIEGFLSPELKKLREEKVQLRLEGKDNDEHKIKRRVAKGDLAIKFGRGLENNKGTTGSKIIQDINGKNVGVFKVDKNEAPILYKIECYFRSWVGQHSCLSGKYGAQPRAEYASYLISKKFGLNLAPPSKMGKLNGVDGVFMVFLKNERFTDVNDRVQKVNYQEFKQIMEKVENQPFFNPNENTLFQKFAIFDYLIGNLDRHEENWFLILDEKTNEITSIKAIDNANAFPRVQPEKDSWAANNQYKWKNLKIAREKFTENTIKFVQEKLTSEAIDEIIKEIKCKNKEFFDENGDMEKFLRLRADVIRNIVKAENTAAILANISTESEMKSFANL